MNFFDAHCDTITTIIKNNEELFSNHGHIDINRMLNFESYTQVFAIWINSKHYNNITTQTLKAIDFFYSQINKNKNFISLITSSNEFRNCENKLKAILALEGGDAINTLEDIYIFYNLGIRILTLTWNTNNKIANGCLDDSRGLSPFGAEIISYMNKLNMIIDVSHLSDKSFWDVANLSKQPIIASHSNVRAICNVKRNLTDEQIIKIAERGGVIGINFYPPFVKSSGYVSSDDIILHINYIINLAGEDCVGIGCDFDGIDDTPTDVKGISDVNIIKNKLNKIYSPATTDKILYKNFERVIYNVL